MFRNNIKRICFHAYLNNSTNVSTKTVTIQWNGFLTDSKIRTHRFFAGVYVRSFVRKPLFFIVTFVTEPVGQF